MTDAPTQGSTSERPPLADVILVTGKGGVGKTTVACGMAVAEANAGRPVALVEFGDGESGLRALGKHKGRIDHVVIRPDEAVTRAASPLFGSGLVARLALGNFAFKRFLRASPALRELAMLECVRLVAAEKRGRRVIVDMPATGHGVAWLRVPMTLREVAQSGPFFELNDRVARELVAPGRCSPVIVTLPERMVLRETVELCDAMQREVGLTVARLVVNRVPSALPPEALTEAKQIGASPMPLANASRVLARALESREGARAEALAALADAASATHLTPVVLPDSPTDPQANIVAEWLRGEGAL